MAGETGIEVKAVTSWDTAEIPALYRSTGWWHDEEDDPSRIPGIIRGSLVFIVAVNRESGKAAGIGRAILRKILAACREHGIGWIALIAEGGSGDFYRGLGFGVEEGEVPMMYQGGGEDAHR